MHISAGQNWVLPWLQALGVWCGSVGSPGDSWRSRAHPLECVVLPAQDSAEHISPTILHPKGREVKDGVLHAINLFLPPALYPFLKDISWVNAALGAEPHPPSNCPRLGRARHSRLRHR